jgi:glycosyltransferase involved in cell wall biosynthesis
LPSIVSDSVGCAPDLIVSGTTGEIFETGSVKSLTQAMEKALSLAGKRDIRNACREQVTGYSVNRAAEGIAQAYESAVGA